VKVVIKTLKMKKTKERHANIWQLFTAYVASTWTWDRWSQKDKDISDFHIQSDQYYNCSPNSTTFSLSVCLSVPFAVRVLLELSCQRFWRRRRRRRRRREDVTHMIIPTVPVFDRKEVCLDYNVSFLSRFKKKNRHFCVKFMSVLLRSAFKSKYSKSVNLFEYTEYAATLHIWRPSPASGTRWRVM